MSGCLNWSIVHGLVGTQPNDGLCVMGITVLMPLIWPNKDMTFLPTSNQLRPFSVALKGLLVVSASALCGVSAVHAGPVGETTMTIGQAIVISANGESRPVNRGSSISVGDRIETAAGGHVHIRFVDGALVSLRPTSRLVVEDYQYNPATPAQSLVRFRLEKGVTRAISGAAAEGARERFRLNTPLVAIGVRGTDFVVSTGPGRTVAAVNQGAIVMAPFGEGCLAQSLGPCGSPAAKLLSADMSNTLVEFKNTLTQVEFKPFNGGKSPETALATLAAPGRAPREAVVALDPVLRQSGGFGGDALTSEIVSEVVQIGSRIRVVAQRPEPVAHSDALRAQPAALLPNPLPPAAVLDSPTVVAPNQLPVVQPVTLPLPPAQLAWGRWSDEALGKLDFTQPRLHARAGRVVTVGDDNFLLYRTEDAAATFAPGLTYLNFALEKGYAQFNSATQQVLPASVDGGSLSVNFAERLFNTALNLSSASTGNVSLQATGSIRSDGIFTSRSDSQAVAGALAFDGKSAGYLFEKAAAGGTLSGITLWSR